MTGFGRGQRSRDGINVQVEIKSLNSRYREFNTKIPSDVSYLEPLLINTLKEHLQRGKINMVINIDADTSQLGQQAFNKKLLVSTYKALQDTATELGASPEIDISQLLHIPTLFETGSESEDIKTVKEGLVQEALALAVERLKKMREDEGHELAQAMLGAVNQLEELQAKVEELAPLRVRDARTRLTERITDLLGNDQFDKERLELEIALLADKLDIEEEFVRLRSHIKFFREAVNGNEPGGRKLNFLTQEMNREINTIGSKSNSADIQHIVVHMKEILEQIREQVQNVE